jgi:hemerythrin-like domain-containing protein
MPVDHRPRNDNTQGDLMATSTASRKSTAAASSKPLDAIALLRADHKKVSELFEQFEKTRSANKKKTLVAQICMELAIHTQIEEEIFYPAVKQALKDKELVPEATVEHDSVKDLISQVEGLEPDGEMYDAKVKVMGEYVKHHVKEEQTEMFPKAKKTNLDMKQLGAEMAERKQQLMADLKQQTMADRKQSTADRKQQTTTGRDVQ